MTTLFPTRLPPLIIRASAGTGKTYQLANRFLRLMDLNVPADQILAVTFTRKAAGEILQRVVERLVAATTQAKHRAALAEAIGYESVDPDYCLELLMRITRQLHQLEVGTLDSYFFHAAQSLPVGEQLPADWSIADEPQQETLWQAAIHQLLEQGGSPDMRQIVHWLCDGEATRSVTRVMLRTVAEVHGLFQSSLRSGEAAWRLTSVGHRLDADSLAAALQCLRELQHDSQSLTSARDAAIQQLEESAWEPFLTKGLAPRIWQNLPYNRQTIPDDWVAAYRPLIEHSRAITLAAHADHTMAAYVLMCRFDVAYQQLKDELQIFDFDDLPRRLVSAGAIRPAGDTWQLRDWDDPGVQHLLLDEFQDTSILQWNALRGMARRTASNASGQSFLCVGDVKQSIYGWRGGVPQLLDGLPAQLPLAELQDLDRSFRSAPDIIDLVNQLFTSLPARTASHHYAGPIASWCRRFRRHTTVRRESGHVTIRSVSAVEHGQTTITATAELVQELHARHPSATIGVLALKNETVAELMFALRERGLSASEEGGQPLTDSAAVQLILSYLWITEHPGDTAASFHVAHSPLGPATGILPSNWQSPLDASRLSDRWRRQLFERGLGTVIEDLAASLQPSCSAHEWRRVQQLMEQAFAWDRRGWTSLAPFVERIRRLRVGSPAATDIRVMTVHKSKGLQFDIVVVTGLDRKLVDPPTFAFERDAETHEVRRVVRYCNQTLQKFLPPQVRQICQATVGQLVEERLSVLYVALTRAQRALHIVMLESNRASGDDTSLAGLIRAGLATPRPQPPSGIWWDEGNPDWQLPPIPAPEALQPPAAADKRPAELAADSPPILPHRRREFVSPSRLERHAAVEPARLFDRHRTAARRSGTAAHRVLEKIVWWSEELESPRKLDEFCRASLASMPVEQLAARADQLASWLASDSVQRVLREDRYRANVAARVSLPVVDVLLSVRAEQPLAAEVDNAWLSGVVDRLILAMDDGELIWAHVIDYKTDQLAADRPAALAERIEFYRPQMHGYQSMVSAALGLPPERVLADLCFVQANQLVAMNSGTAE